MLADLGERERARASGPLTVRLAAADDARELERIAELDSAAMPAPPLLLSERDGRLVAAVSLADGAVIADPFDPTADVVALLALRARQLTRRPPRRRGGRRALAWRMLRAGG
jgi:hypothetical protein